MSDDLGRTAHEDPTTAGYFAAAREGVLQLQRCRSCHAHQFYPRVHCVHCGGLALDLVAATGRGVIYSLTRVHLEVMSHLPPPYFVGLVALDEGPRITANLDEGERYIGEKVCLTWRTDPTGRQVPLFSPPSPRSSHDHAQRCAPGQEQA